MRGMRATDKNQLTTDKNQLTTDSIEHLANY